MRTASSRSGIPYQGAGAPLAANMQSAVFDPLLLAVNLHPTPLTWDLSIIGAFVLGAAAAYLFGRVLGLQVVPAVVTSAAFSLSGWFFLYSNNHFSRSYVFLPLLFLLVELTLRSRRLWPVLRARRCRRREHLRRDARGVVLRDRRRCGVRGGATRPAATADADPRLTRSTRRRGPAGPAAGRAARPPVPAVRVPVVQRAQAGVRKWVGGGSSVGPPQLDRPVLPRRRHPAPSVRNWFGVAVGISALVAMSGRTETKRLHAWLFLALGVVLLAQDLRLRRARLGRPACRSPNRSSFRRSRRPSSRSRSQCWRGSAFRCCGIATSDCDAS